MIALRVWATLADGTRLHAGDLAFSDPDAHGRYESEFEYTANWLVHPDACDLDPESLRMSSGRIRYRSTNLFPPLAVFENNTRIVDRPYQHEAIRRVAEAFAVNRRRALLIMATGTGKPSCM